MDANRSVDDFQIDFCEFEPRAIFKGGQRYNLTHKCTLRWPSVDKQEIYIQDRPNSIIFPRKPKMFARLATRAPKWSSYSGELEHPEEVHRSSCSRDVIYQKAAR